jgi:hypothetical protein
MKSHLSARIALVLFLSVLTFGSPEFVRAVSSPDGFWQAVDRLPDAPANARQDIRPEKYQLVTLDAARLRDRLAQAPKEFTTTGKDFGIEITLPMPDGKFARFRVEDSPVMHPDLAAKFPEIKTYAGRGVDDPAARVRLDINARTFHAQILSPHGSIYIDPYWHLDGSVYMSYYKRDLPHEPNRQFSCHVEHEYSDVDPNKLRDLAEIDNSESGKNLRIYRLACATSTQYSSYHSSNPANPTVPEVMAALVTMNNRVSGIYETEMGIRMVYVPNNDVLISTLSNPQPYSDTPGDIDLNPPNLDTRIGIDNYDIGHVVTVGSGGVAGLGVVCREQVINGVRRGIKARGTTGLNPPTGDPFWVDYVAHEMGHQFGGNHTFNGSGTNCGTQQNPNTAYEPGSGSTIQAYAGICGAANNLQPNSDPYFHFISLTEMFNYATIGSGRLCPVLQPTGNNPPTVSARLPGQPAPPTPAYTIPARTPFSLRATGSDPETDDITYAWEEADLGPAKAGNAPDNGASALFRSYTPTLNPTRIFPSIQYILNNANTPPASYPCGDRSCIPGEQLPTTTRKMDFRVTARDNRGGFGMDTIRLNVVDTGAGFAVTAPNTAATIAGGSTFTVTWNVAGTNATGIDTQNVNILLTTNATPTNGEVAFPVVLAANTPNDGSQEVTIPNIPTSKARIKVEAAGNVFFDVSDADFTISSSLPELSSVVSRMGHGSAGEFDIDLPLAGTPGLESRRGGANSEYTLVFRFANTLTAGTASVTGGTASVNFSGIGGDAREFIVQLIGVTDAQTVTVTLNNVTDSTGRTGNVAASMRVLVGDVNADGAVNSGDAIQTRVRAGQTVTATTFRSDVNSDGIINSGDALIVRSRSGNTVP